MPFSSSQTATNYQRVTWWILGFLGHISQYSRLLTLSQLQSGKPHLVIWDVMNIHEHSECVHGLSYSLRCKIGESNLESHQCIQGMTLPYVQACFFFPLRESSSWKIHEHLGRPTSKNLGIPRRPPTFSPESLKLPPKFGILSDWSSNQHLELIVVASHSKGRVLPNLGCSQRFREKNIPTD